MARKPGVPYIPGTDVLDLQKYRSNQRMMEIVGYDPNFYILDDKTGRLGLGDNFLDHHNRMMKATEELRRKAAWAKTKNSPAPKST